MSHGRLPIGPHSDLQGRPPSRSMARCLGSVLLFGAVIGAIILSGGLSGRLQSTEAYHRAMVARDLLAGASRGRQGLVGSLVLPPLPTIIVSILYVVPHLEVTRVAGPLVAGVSALLLCLYTDRLWAREGLSARVRYPAICCILLFPPVAMSIEAGQSTALFLLLTVAGWGFLADWLRGFELRDLAYASLLLGLSIGVRYQGLFIATLALVLVALAAALERHRRAMVEGTVITYALPGCYAILLWIGGNWLILGDPVFFLGGLAHSIHIGTADPRAILTTNCEWTILAAVTVAVLSVPVVSRLAPGLGSWSRQGAALAGLAAAVAVVLLGGTREVRLPDPRIPRTVARLSRDYPNGSFIVTGYEGYRFKQAAGRDPHRQWIHRMHLEGEKLGAILRDFHGRDIYLLVNSERTVEKWQRLGLEWRGPAGRIPERFLYLERSGPWLVFEVLRSEEDRPGQSPGA